MANNGRIRFLRANTSDLDSTEKLKAGQPLYIADKKDTADLVAELFPTEDETTSYEKNVEVNDTSKK